LRELGLNERPIRTIKYLKSDNYITNPIYQKINSTSERTALRDINDLLKKGVLLKNGDKKNAEYKLNT